MKEPPSIESDMAIARNPLHTEHVRRAAYFRTEAAKWHYAIARPHEKGEPYLDIDTIPGYIVPAVIRLRALADRESSVMPENP